MQHNFMKVAIIGAGLGGLSAACLLASRGYRVSVYEKNDAAGGKMNIEKAGGFRFDTGPSLLTMPFVLDELFARCGEAMDDHLALEALSPLCRYFYRDGTIFNSYTEQRKTLGEIERIAPNDRDAYRRFMEYAAGLYEHTADAFLFNPLYNMSDLKGIELKGAWGIDAFRTVSRRIDHYFQSPYLRKFFKRFTTYNGSSPLHAPATLNVIPHVEINQGGYYVRGGLYQIVRTLKALAESRGARFHFNSPARKIITKKGEAGGIELQNGTQIPADLVISNSDYTETMQYLLEADDRPIAERIRTACTRPSCSGFVMLLGVDRRYEQLAHHNIFFPEDYQREFRQIFEQMQPADDPTIYVANTSAADPHHAPPGCSNLFVLVNAPFLTGRTDWAQTARSYGSKIIERLEKYGLHALSEHIAFKQTITPRDFQHRYRAWRGSIYGTSSNSRWSAFMRPANKSRHIDHLYFTGGSTHPGGGIPLVILSALHAVELISRYEED